MAESKTQIKILVAENDQSQRLALVDILKHCNYKVTAVENGKLAKDELMKKESSYDLIFLDLKMPEMSGLELLIFMQTTENLKNIPVVMLSTEEEMDSVAACINNGAKDYLLKPIRIQNVRGCLASQINCPQNNRFGKTLGQEHGILNQNGQIKVLVAEDDNFQRLALIDILELCNYEVTAVENGKLAIDELMNEENSYDIFLLDIMMPEIDGLEVLTFMQREERLKNMPVIMMSSNEEMESLSACLNTGAKDYLIKPIRIQNIKGLASHVNLNERKQKKKTFGDYQVIRVVSKKADSSLSLVRDAHNGEFYAQKNIEFGHMNSQERLLVENEISLLQVLSGPTIIQYYGHCIRDYITEIIMEYAEKGPLSDRFNDHKMKGEPISNSQILDWSAQLVLGLLSMHSKGILHRDIRSTNLYLAKGDIIKLGHFAFSKPMTRDNLSMTYFMPPDVCQGEKYTEKSDVWALGCIIYEMATLKKPFDSAGVPGMGLINKICDGDFEPLPGHVDPNIKMLIYSMLQKDPVKRLSIWEIAQSDIIRERILKSTSDHRMEISGEMFFGKNKDKKDSKEELNSSIKSYVDNLLYMEGKEQKKKE